MQVEQAIFTSAQTGRMRGYQLAAKSAGVSACFAQELTHWGPSQSALVSRDVHSQSLNFFPLVGERVAVTRTIYGGPEYSGRGQLQTVTQILLLHRDQMSGYDFNPLALTLTAIVLGRLRLQIKYGSELPRVELPDTTPLGLHSRPPAILMTQPALQKALKLLRQKQRLAIVGTANSVDVLEYLLARTPPEERAELSFTTGLLPSSVRPFHLHFLPSPEVRGRQLSSHGISYISHN